MNDSGHEWSFLNFREFVILLRNFKENHFKSFPLLCTLNIKLKFSFSYLFPAIYHTKFITRIYSITHKIYRLQYWQVLSTFPNRKKYEKYESKRKNTRNFIIEKNVPYTSSVMHKIYHLEIQFLQFQVFFFRLWKLSNLSLFICLRAFFRSFMK